jgi:hypothetical protein
MLWSLADAREDRLLVVDYPYFERPEPSVFDEGGTYVETEATFEHNLTHEWNHGLAETITALQDAGLELTALAEHDSAPWPALPGMMEKDDAGEWRLTDRPWRLPCTYTLQAVKRR